MKLGRWLAMVLLVLLVGAACSDSSDAPADGRVVDGRTDTARDVALSETIADRGSDAPDDVGGGESVGDIAVGDSSDDASSGDSTVDAGTPDAKVMCGKIRCDCTLDGINLWGKVRYVNALADFKIREVNNFGDLKVQKVKVLPNSCGKWREVQALPDFTVQVVNVGEDFQVRYVNNFPGVAKP